MSQNNIFKIITVIAGCSLTLVTWQSMSAKVPEPWAPFSMLHILLFLATGSSLLFFSWATIAFWVWNPGAFNGTQDVPKRSLVLYCILAALSIRCAGRAHGFSKCAGLPKVHVFLFIIVEGFIMTQLLFLALFFFLAFPVSAEKETPKIDLRVNGVGAWTPYSTVINKLGKPLRSKKVRTPANLFCSGEDEKQVLVKFGEPDFKEESSKETAFVYSMKDGIGAVTFFFRHGRLIEISMEGTLC